MKVPLQNIKGEIVDYAIVDEDDFVKVAEHSWCKTLEGYANGTINSDPIRMHQFIIGKAQDGNVIDHKNGNKLDNRRENLAYVTKKQNAQNAAKKENSSSIYKGVSWNKARGKWSVSSTLNGKQVHLGLFDNEIACGKQYDTFVLLHYGVNAKTNGLVSFDEVKDIELASLLKTRQKTVNAELPKYIVKTGNYFQVHIAYKRVKYSQGAQTLEGAIEKVKEIHAIIEKRKQEDKAKHFSREIIRNDSGDAIIPTRYGDLMVSDDRWHDCMQYTWSKTREYYRTIIDGKMVKLHHYIMGVSGDSVLIDHIDHNPRNNKDDNLRLSNSVNNNHNRAKKQNSSSQYQGVSFYKLRNKFRATIRKEGTTYRLGSFDDEGSAAKAYNVKAQELYGEFANLNIIE